MCMKFNCISGSMFLMNGNTSVHRNVQMLEYRRSLFEYMGFLQRVRRSNLRPNTLAYYFHHRHQFQNVKSGLIQAPPDKGTMAIVFFTFM